ncbi:MAG: sulfotransferase [Roseiarcus sp.]|jgi:tetratricopeptide (TPR) repeat protein
MPRVDDQRKLQTAHSLHQKGALDEAAKLYRELIGANPDNFHALHFLGLIEAHSGNMQRAKLLMARSLSIQPPNIQFMENYATALYQTADYIGALKICRKGLKLNGNNISLLYVSAASLSKLGQFQESLMQFDRLLLIQPNHFAAHNERGFVLAEMKNYELAIASIDNAIKIYPNYADAYLNKGNLYALRKRHDEAVAAYDKALTINPALASAWFGRGIVLRELNRLEEAVTSLDEAIALAPDHAEAHNRKAIVLLDWGRLVEASHAIEKAIDLAPKRASFYHILTVSKRLSPGDPRLRAMEELAQDMPSLGTDDQIALHFALAKAFADNEDHARSFQRLIAGNALKRKQSAYDEAAALGFLERTRRAYAAELMRGDRGRGDPSSLPVFILGMPRSGTTLVEQILASHPQVFGAGEIGHFHQATMALGGAAGEALHSPEAVSQVSDEQLRRLGASYLGRIRDLAPAAARIINKTPENFRLIGLIHLALPNARIIHMRRDPIDTCLSCFSQMFTDTVPYAFDLGELGRYYRAYEATMAHWRSALPANVMLEVQYEEVVADLEGQARRIVAHCGLEWDSRCLSFHQTKRSVQTASVIQVRQPIYKSAVGRWRAYEAFLGPLLAELGIVDEAV